MRTLCLAALLLPTLAAAEDVELRQLETCGPFKGALEIADKFAELDADRRDVVDVPLSARFVREADEPLPERVFYRSEGVETDLVIAPDGEVADLFETARGLPLDGLELCTHDSHLAGKPIREARRNFDVGMMPEFTTLTGSHTLAELEEGLKDGRKFFKKMAPAAVSFMVPKLTHILVGPPPGAPGELATPVAYRGEERLGVVAGETFDNSLVIDPDDLEAMGADRLVIEGSYRLFPVPKPETMRKFAQRGG